MFYVTQVGSSFVAYYAVVFNDGQRYENIREENDVVRHTMFTVNNLAKKRYDAFRQGSK